MTPKGSHLTGGCNDKVTKILPLSVISLVIWLVMQPHYGPRDQNLADRGCGIEQRLDRQWSQEFAHAVFFLCPRF